MSNPTELLNCPFCGGDAQTDFIEGESYLIECYACRAETGIKDSEEDAIAAWNRRAALASRPAEVDDEGLPPLPDHIEVGGEGWDIEDFKSEKTFTVDHLWQYARYAVVADRAQRGDGWISVDDRMPGKERCLAAYLNAMGKHRIIRAMYADQFQIDAGEDAIDQGNCEYNEADDTFYLKAGWLECIDNWDDYSSIYVTEGTVTHWRRLPAAPSHTTNKEK